jgi:hypothetical protein
MTAVDARAVYDRAHAGTGSETFVDCTHDRAGLSFVRWFAHSFTAAFFIPQRRRPCEQSCAAQSASYRTRSRSLPISPDKLDTLFESKAIIHYVPLRMDAPGRYPRYIPLHLIGASPVALKMIFRKPSKMQKERIRSGVRALKGFDDLRGCPNRVGGTMRARF